MRAMLLLIATCCMLAVASVTSAAETEFQLAPRAGVGHLRIDIPQRAIATPDIFSTGVTAGVLTPIGIVLNGGMDYSGYYTFLGFEEVRFNQAYATAGYQFELGHGWRVVPAAGWAYWELHRFGFLVPKAERQRLSGHDPLWSVSVSRRISRRVALGVAHQQGNYDFGRARETTFMVTIGF